jgi:hypothetical protein
MAGDSRCDLDIEHLFGLQSGRNRTDVLSPKCPGGSPKPPERSTIMAMVRVAPVAVRVRTDWFDGRPVEITWGEHTLPVRRLALVRRETSAFPVVVGPRTVFEVDTPLARLTLSYRHRSRRWTIEGMEDAAAAA